MPALALRRGVSEVVELANRSRDRARFGRFAAANCWRRFRRRVGVCLGGICGKLVVFG